MSSWPLHLQRARGVASRGDEELAPTPAAHALTCPPPLPLLPGAAKRFSSFLGAA